MGKWLKLSPRQQKYALIFACFRVFSYLVLNDVTYVYFYFLLDSMSVVFHHPFETYEHVKLRIISPQIGVKMKKMKKPSTIDN